MHARTCLIMVAAAIMMAGSTVLADGFDAAKWQSFTEYSKYIHVDPGEFYGFGSLSFTEWSNPLNEDFYLRFSIKNIGSADAETVSVKVKNNQSGVLLIGVVDGNNLQRRHPQFAKIAVDKHEMVTYRFFVNTDFKDLLWGYAAAIYGHRNGTLQAIWFPGNENDEDRHETGGRRQNSTGGNR